MSATAAPPADVSWEGLGVGIAEVLDRLAEQRRPADGGPPLTLPGILNLVAHAPAAEDVAEVRSVIEALAGHQPSRAVLLVEPSGGSGIDATVSTSCRLSGGRVTVGAQLVVLSLHGESRAGDASAILPLLRADLPTVLWWPDAPDPSPDGPLARLAPLADRIVTEAARGASGPAAIVALARWAPTSSAAVTDLAWAAITPWRQLIAQIVAAADPPEALGSVRARIAHPHPAPTAQALLLAGWLRDAVGAGLEVEMEGCECDAPLAGIVIDVPATGRRLAIDCVPGRAAATVSVEEPGHEARTRTMPLPAPERARLLAGELELQRRDLAFERALPFAAEVARR